MSFSQPKCCICLENKEVYTECKHCKDGKYCETCINKLIEENKYITCSVCRQENWYNNKKQLQILIDKQKKVIGTSLDETYISSDEEDIISNELEHHEENYCKKIRDICCSISLIILLTFLGWVTIFGLSEVKLNVPDNYQSLCILIISLFGGFALTIGFWGLFIGFIKINTYCKYNNYITCGEFIVILISLTLFLTLITIPGYLFTFTLCELSSDYSNNKIDNIFIVIFISLASGILLTIGCIILFLINNKFYEIVKNRYGVITAECCCNPAIIFLLIVFSCLITIIGWNIMFNLIKINLNVNHNHEFILKIIISYAVGISVCIFPTLLHILICNNNIKCKCNKNEINTDSSISVEVVL